MRTLIQRLLCPKIHACPYNGVSCSKCQQTVKEDAAAVLEVILEVLQRSSVSNNAQGENQEKREE
ncbi:MAG TPA: hypothetical protein IAC31_09025 [Candidatus Faecousia intestinigallinarum]|nr:hypothetical protein [Candidatus Faecousia intestinigallinarum]